MFKYNKIKNLIFMLLIFINLFNSLKNNASDAVSPFRYEIGIKYFSENGYDVEKIITFTMGEEFDSYSIYSLFNDRRYLLFRECSCEIFLCDHNKTDKVVQNNFLKQVSSFVKLDNKFKDFLKTSNIDISANNQNLEIQCKNIIPVLKNYLKNDNNVTNQN
jgi:hypothetical protein